MRAGVIAPLLLVLASCETTTFETVTTEYPLVSISEEWVEFGEVHLDEVATHTLYITNEGDLPLGIADIIQGEGHDRNFAIRYDPCEVVCPGDPADTGLDDGTGGTTDGGTTDGGTGGTTDGGTGDTGDTGSADAALFFGGVGDTGDTGDTGGSGTGTGGTGTGTDGGTGSPEGPEIAVDRLVLDYGEVLPPNTGTDWLVVTNEGTEDLAIYEAIQDGSTAFVVLNDLTGAVLTSGESTNVYVYYQPNNTGGDEGTLTFKSNDEDEPETVVTLLGNQGLDPTGTTDGGGTTGTETEPEECPSGDAAVEFVLDAGCRIPVEVTMAPKDLGDAYTALTVVSLTQERPEDWEPEGVGDEFEPAYYSDYLHERVTTFIHGVALSDNGDAVVTPRTIDFGHIWPGDSGLEYIEILNTGDAPLELSSPSLDVACNPGYEVTYSYGDGASVEPGNGAIIEVTFTPQDERDAYCTLYIQTSDPNAAQVPVSMQGNVGTDPANSPPRVEILDPAPGYVHSTSDPLEMTIALSDANQPVTTLSCKVRSAVMLEATLPEANCTPERETGAVTVYIDINNFEPGVDTLQVEVIDDATAVGMASIPVLIHSRAETSDDDGDGFGDAAGVAAHDCDDQYIYTYPEAAEIYDERDNDCDLLIDEGTDGYDDDGDRFAEDEGDCNDYDSSTYPGGPEDIDSRDNNCDGLIDEGTALYDDDGDGYADINNDCDDRDETVNPGAEEICDLIDNNCNGVIDDDCVDLETEPLFIGPIVPEQTSVEEGEIIQLYALAYEGDEDELLWVWSSDYGEFRDDGAVGTASWTAPVLEDDSVGLRANIYLTVEDPDLHNDVLFAEVVVYPEGSLYKVIEEQVEVPAEDTGGCSSAPAGDRPLLPGALLAGLGLAAALLRR